MIDLNRFMSGALAGLFAGLLIAGIGGRLAMRLVAILGGIQAEFTLDGTIIILILGGLLGVIVGAMYGSVRRLIPVPDVWRGVLFGSLLAILTGLPFFLNPEGELALASPLVGVALFTWIPLSMGIVIELLLQRIEKRYENAPERSVGVAWFIAMVASLFLALFSMFTLADEYLYLPPLIARLAFEMEFREIRSLHATLNLIFALCYCGLCLLIFWQGVEQRLARFTALALLLFAAGFINSGHGFVSGLHTLDTGRILAGLLRAAGLTALLSIFLLWPDGVFRSPWTKWVLGLWAFIWMGMWLFVPIFDPRSAIQWEPIVLVLVWGGLFSGLVVRYMRYRHADPTEQERDRSLVSSLTIVLFAYLLVWIVQIMYPDLRGRSTLLVSTPFTFMPFLVIWLLLPLSFWMSMRRISGQEDGGASMLPPQLASQV